MVDKSIAFGNQNFLFVKADTTTDATYDYVASMTKKGSILIGRFKKDDTEGLYYSAVGAFAGIWAGRAGYTYVLPTNLVEPSY